MLKEIKETIREAIEKHYGELNDRGCYSGDTGEWLSTEAIFDIVCDALDEYDWCFEEE